MPPLAFDFRLGLAENANRVYTHVEAQDEPSKPKSPDPKNRLRAD